MSKRYGRVYKPRGIMLKLGKFVGILLLVLVGLFFYLYFTWQQYIVYTDDGLYLDLPFMDSDSGGKDKPSSAGPVSDSLTGDGTAADDGDDVQGTDDADGTAGSDNVTTQNGFGDDDAATSDDGNGDSGADSAGDDTADDSQPSDDGDSTADDKPEDNKPEDDKPEDDKPKDDGVKNSFT